MEVNSVVDAYIFLSDPDPGSYFFTDPAGAGSYLEIFVTIEKNILSDCYH
jgi:hypothetical protein